MLLKLITVFSLFVFWRKEVSANPQPQNAYTNTWRCLGSYKGLCSKTSYVVCAMSHSSYPSPFCFSLSLPVLYQKAQAQFRADVGQCESVSSRRQILGIDDNYFVILHGLHHGDGHLANGATVLSNQGLLLS